MTRSETTTGTLTPEFERSFSTLVSAWEARETLRASQDFAARLAARRDLDRARIEAARARRSLLHPAA